MKKNSFFFGLLIFSVLLVFSNYKVFQVYIGQDEVFRIIATSDYEMEDSYRDRISSGYPSLSSTVIPFKSILGAYWIINDSIDKGLNLLKAGQKDNPYLGYSDMLYAGLFEEVGMKDSFTYYARQAVSKLPNAPQHYVLLAKVLINEGKYDSLQTVFDQIKDKVNDRQVWKVYLAGALNHKDKMDSLKLVENAKLAKAKFSFDDIRLSADYIIYGQDVIKKFVELKEIAIDTFADDPEYGIKIMNEIISIVNDNVFHYETLIEMYFKEGKFEKVIELYDELVENDMTNVNAIIVEFIAISYVNINNLQFGCNLSQQLNSAGYKLSPSLALVCNIVQ